MAHNINSSTDCDYTVVRDIFTMLKFRDFKDYFRGHMLHEATPIYARGI